MSPAVKPFCKTLLKKLLLRYATFAPLWIFLVVGFRPSAAVLSSTERFHPAMVWSSPVAALVLAAFCLGWLAFEPVALGVILFLMLGTVGVVLHSGPAYDLIHGAYGTLEQTMLFLWIAAVFIVLAPWRPAVLVGADGPHTRLAAWLLVALAVAAALGAWWLHPRVHPALVGGIPFVAVIGGRTAARWWVGKK